jgi:signal transduction histidine kinase
MYGERDEPAAVLSRLGQRLEASLEPDSILPSVVETVGQALKLPYVAIALKDGTDFVIAAEYGRFMETAESRAELIKMLLTYQSETVGELIVAPRAANEQFSPADMKLLSMLSQQAGVAAHAIRLTHELRSLNLDLQKSREQLVTAREEERRRIRRDLHDGVGPILASLLQRLDAVRLLIPRDPEKAAGMAEDLKGQVKTTIADIRRLVYALRPPVLDELGLVSAIREHTRDYQGAGNLQVTLTASETLPHLPAAVEVAAYRIILEAFANVVHHSQATTCEITIRIEKHKTGHMFCVEVKDNGQGFPDKHRAGVGLISIRERTAELGGAITIESRRSHGTLVRACLPFSEEEK